ncbi:MAG: hypothetical protein BA863_00855 [Desulfovibrio sp. S3730MH75]|nr:MAG: hypothetical protein BA863_00855 [Desulfovibrio sp. S3730MH75]
MSLKIRRQTGSSPIFTAMLGVLLIIAIGGCSEKTISGQPFVVPFDSKYITTENKISIAPSLKYDGSRERSFLSITQHRYMFGNSNGTAVITVLLNRKSNVVTPEIGEWNAVSVGDCLSDSDEVQCFTAHVDCHLVRTTFIPLGERSIAVIKARDGAREPQELCERWDLINLTEIQREGVEEFNRVTDSLFKFDIPIPEIIIQPASESKKKSRKRKRVRPSDLK